MNELKPCPFCGCKNILIYLESTAQEGSEKYYRANCARCTSFTLGRNEQEALMTWNTRVESSEQWISVKDRLPENDEYVLTYCECSTKSVRSNWYSSSRKLWHEGDDNITHWMPLPDPPR
jgi:Lar family restriction alleviation protein